MQKPLSCFHKASSWQCKDCHSQYTKEHYKNNKDQKKKDRAERWEAEKSASPSGTKKCDKCSQDRPFSSFRKDGTWWCLDCRREYGAKWAQDNREQSRETQRAWISRNRARNNLIRRNRRTDKQRALAERLRDNYGLSLPEYNKMLEASSGLCAICRQPTDKFHVDHCHSTGKVRELLCRGCNHGIGNFRENLAALEAAIAYLKKHGGK